MCGALTWAVFWKLKPHWGGPCRLLLHLTHCLLTGLDGMLQPDWIVSWPTFAAVRIEAKGKGKTIWISFFCNERLLFMSSDITMQIINCCCWLQMISHGRKWQVKWLEFCSMVLNRGCIEAFKLNGHYAIRLIEGTFCSPGQLNHVNRCI